MRYYKLFCTCFGVQAFVLCFNQKSFKNYILWLDNWIKDSTTLFSASLPDLTAIGFLQLSFSSTLGSNLFFIGRFFWFSFTLSFFGKSLSFSTGLSFLFTTFASTFFPSRIGLRHNKSSFTCSSSDPASEKFAP
jgi:hypothetical protein